MGEDMASEADLKRPAPPEQRGRRIWWGTWTIGLFVVIAVAAGRLAEAIDGPGPLVVGAIALGYVIAVTYLWARRGPYVAGLHGRRGDSEKTN